MRQLITTFMVSVGLRAQITHPGVRSMCHIISTLVPSLLLEAPRVSCTDDQCMAILIRLHREQPGGRASATHAGKDSVSEVDQNDKLLADPLYIDLHTKVLALDAWRRLTW